MKEKLNKKEQHKLYRPTLFTIYNIQCWKNKSIQAQ